MEQELFLPDSVRDEYDLEAAKDIAYAGMFRRLLQSYDDQLDLIWAKPEAKSLQGGYWYIVRRNGSKLPAGIWQVCNPDGSYCEPREEHFERIKQIDAQRNPGFYAEYCKKRDARTKAGEKHEEELHREFREKLVDRVKFLSAPSVIVPKDLMPQANREQRRDAGKELKRQAAKEVNPHLKAQVRRDLAGHRRHES